MAGKGQTHVATIPYPNSRASEEQHDAFHNLDHQVLSLGNADFWPPHDGLFTAGLDILPTLHQPETSLPATASEIARGGLLTGNQSRSEMDCSFAADANGAVELHERLPSPFPYDNVETLIPNHYGPGYWLSICSGPGRAWICKRIGSDEFEEISEELQDSWAKALKLEHNEPASKSAEPEPQLAWKYCKAYFERSVDGLFGAVYRPEFERYLRAHLSGKLDYNDSAWYALCNVVYAGGCRISRSEDPSANFVDVQREAWGYFQNSLSVHSELLLTRPSLRSVRALLAMGLFADGLASPALSSGLVSNAALLAQSLGLHRKTVEIGPNGGLEALQRTWLFWGVYCSEKHIAQRCGRPSVIDDDDIDCDIPSILHTASSTEPEMLTYIIQTCQIYDQISKELLATQALYEPPKKMFDLVAHFDAQLRFFKEALPKQLRPADCLKQFHMPGTLKMLGLMTTHCSFYDLLMLVHTIFAYPWVTESFPGNLDASLAAKVKTQIAASSQIVADAARSLIVIARNLDIDRAGTQSFMLHFPMHAFINLFVYVIANPEIPSVKSDLALLDVAAGYFGQMEFVTGSKLRFPFARDIAAIARKVVDEASAASLSDGPAQSLGEPQFHAPVISRMDVHNPLVNDFDSWIS